MTLKHLHIIFISVCTLLTACSSDSEEQVEPLHAIQFVSSVGEMQTRATLNGAGYDRFAAWMDKHTQGDEAQTVMGGADGYQVMYNTTNYPNEGLTEHWGYDKETGQITKYWDLSCKDHTCIAYTVNPWETTNQLGLIYTANEGLKNLGNANGNTFTEPTNEVFIASYIRNIAEPQKSYDAVLGYPEGADGKRTEKATDPIPLTFHHSMACIQIRIYQEKGPKNPSHLIGYDEFEGLVYHCATEGKTDISIVNGELSYHDLSASTGAEGRFIGAGLGDEAPTDASFNYAGSIPQCATSERATESLAITPNIYMVPQQFSSGLPVFSFFLKIAKTGEGRSVIVRSENTPNETFWRAGHKYTYYLVLPEDYDDTMPIKVVLEVEPWIDGGTITNIQTNW